MNHDLKLQLLMISVTGKMLDKIIS